MSEQAPAIVERGVVDAFGGAEAFDAALAEFREALESHATTVNVPAPTAHPYVEEIVRNYRGAYEILEAEPATGPAAAPEFEPIPVPEAVEPAWPLAQLREWKLAELAHFRWLKQRTGVTFNGTFQVPADRETVTDLFATRQLTPEGATVLWKANGQFMQLGVDQIDALLAQLRAHMQLCYDREAKVVPQIRLIEDKAAMKAFDVAQHWPSS